MRSALRLVQLAALLSVTTVAACASTPEPSEPPTTVRGLYIFHDGAHTLRPCGSNDTYWIIGGDPLMEPLRTRSSARSTALGQPHQGIYAEITGALESPAQPDVPPGYQTALRAQGAHVLADHQPASCSAPAVAPAAAG